MPEHEIAKHTKAVYTAWRDPHTSWKHKFIEVTIEIGIIVFAITLSLLLERWRENAHDRSIEKTFLLGLKKDLQADITQLKGDSVSYVRLEKSWTYLRNAGDNHETISRDTLNKYGETFINTTSFIANDSRFDALKSSGHFDVIENDSLQDLILDLYQNRIRSLKLATDAFTQFKTGGFSQFIFQNLRLQKDGSNNISQLVQMPEMQNYLMMVSIVPEITSRYHDVIVQSEQIIEMIDQQYHNN